MGRPKRPHLGSFQVLSTLGFVRLSAPYCAGPGSDFLGPSLEGRCQQRVARPEGARQPASRFLLILGVSNSEKADCRKNVFRVRPDRSPLCPIVENRRPHPSPGAGRELLFLNPAGIARRRLNNPPLRVKLSLSSCAHSGSEFLEQLVRLGPVDAAVGHALAVSQRSAGNQ